MNPPPRDTLEGWAWELLTADDLARKLSPPPPPEATEPDAPPRRLTAPSRPAPLRVVERAPKTPAPEAMRDPAMRARVLHGFIHHEVQAAELMAWAILAWPDAPPAFRRGLAQIARDEARHVAMYSEHLERLGSRYGDLPVRDWFWQRLPTARDPSQFVATMGVGLEGANLDHAARFAQRFAAAGDPEGARVVALVGEEELPHVRFALRWLQRFAEAPAVTYALWAASLTPPLTPWVMRATPVDREARARAGFTPEFVSALEQAGPERPEPAR